MLGKPFSGFVTVNLAVTVNGTKYSDSVQLRVAPMILTPNTQASTAVWCSNSSTPLNTALGQTGQQQLVDSTVSQWIQDHVEIGYYEFQPLSGASGAGGQAPGSLGTSGGLQQIDCTFRTPYGRSKGDADPLWPVLLPSNPPSGGNAQKCLQSPTQATFEIGSYLSDTPPNHGGNFGGNIDCLLPTSNHPLGCILVGNTASPKLIELLQHQVQPVVIVDSSWLDVGHVDEFLMPGPPVSGSTLQTLFVADPTLGLSLVQDLTGQSPRAMLFGDSQATAQMSVVNVDPQGNIAVNLQSPPPNALLRDVGGPTNTSRWGNVYLASYVSSLGRYVVQQMWNSGAAFTEDEGKPWSIFQAVTSQGTPPAPNSPLPGDTLLAVGLQSKYWEVPGPIPTFPAIVSADELGSDTAMQSLTTKCQQKVNAALAAVQSFLGSDMTSLNVVSVPAVFIASDSSDSQGDAEAYIPGMTNMQFVGNGLFTPNPFVEGPNLNTDPFFLWFENSVSATGVDDWVLYHGLTGEVHCATAVRRSPFGIRWWTALKN